MPRRHTDRLAVELLRIWPDYPPGHFIIHAGRADFLRRDVLVEIYIVAHVAMNWLGWGLSTPGIIRVRNYNLIHVRENPNLRWHANFRNFMREQSVGLIGRFRVTKWIAEGQGSMGGAGCLSYDIANVGSDIHALCVIRDKSRAEKNLRRSQRGSRSGISEVGGKVERQEFFVTDR